MTPFQMSKSFTYEDGILVLAIAWGPGIEDNVAKREFAHVMDVALTIYELAGVTHPGAEHNGQPMLPVRGKSMLP